MQQADTTNADHKADAPRSFVVDLVRGDHVSMNGSVRPRVVLTIGGDQVCVEKVTLDSHGSVVKTAKRWAGQYTIDATEAESRLRDLGTRVVAEQAERRASTEATPKATKRVSAQAAGFIRQLKPTWHRDRRSIYFEAIDAEVPTAGIWKHASDQHIDAVTHTIEGVELYHDGEPPSYRVRLGLFRDAVAMAVARIMGSLPEVANTETDATVDRDQLIHQIAAVLLLVRVFRRDVGETVNESYLGWASGIEPGSAWQRCFAEPTFARLDAAGAQPRIAIVGDHLTKELRRESKRKLAADLRATGLAKTDTVLRHGAKLWRAWELDPAVLDSVATPEKS